MRSLSAPKCRWDVDYDGEDRHSRTGGSKNLRVVRMRVGSWTCRIGVGIISSIGDVLVGYISQRTWSVDAPCLILYFHCS